MTLPTPAQAQSAPAALRLYAGMLRPVLDQWHFEPCDSASPLPRRARDVSPESSITSILTDIGLDRRDTTYIEAFGRVVAEAQAMGRPVVAPAHGAAPEILVEGETGWTFAPGRADELAVALGKALALDGDARTALSDKAILHVRGNFTKERMCAATLDVYEELLRESRPEVWR